MYAVGRKDSDESAANLFSLARWRSSPALSHTRGPQAWPRRKGNYPNCAARRQRKFFLWAALRTFDCSAASIVIGRRGGIGSTDRLRSAESGRSARTNERWTVLLPLPPLPLAQDLTSNPDESPLVLPIQRFAKSRSLQLHSVRRAPT